MKPKSIVTVLLLLFVGASVVALVIKERTPEAADARATASEEAGASAEVAVTEDVRASGVEQSPATLAETEIASAAEMPEIAEEEPQSAESAQDEKVIVYYFHGTKRCATCMKLESYTGETVNVTFASLIEDGSLEWRVVNVDQPGNGHFVKDYELVTKSVVLSRQRGGAEVEWKDLDQIWNLVGDRGAYENYIRREVETFVTGEAKEEEASRKEAGAV